VIITGASPGSLAFEAAKSIAAKQPGLLVLTARNESLLQQTKDAILTDVADVDIKLVAYDLSKQETIRKAVTEIKGLNVKFDVIINSAGVMAPPYALTEEEIESQFGINHIGRPPLTSVPDCTAG
jgi:short-subunit dehydrogenase